MGPWLLATFWLFMAFQALVLGRIPSVRTKAYVGPAARPAGVLFLVLAVLIVFVKVTHHP